MKPTLVFSEEIMDMSSLGEEASIPDIMPTLNLQNKMAFDLDEDDEIYEGYGKVETVYPYRQYTCYDRKTKPCAVKTAVLENDKLKAVFLPELGGRLWRLIDKERDVNLLYTNDVIRPSNLATRNAWFSGGVEWNIGIIGHTPLTMDPLFTATLEDEAGNPILRMYEYERIRKVVYQMDFWLEDGSSFLNCGMRVVNDSTDVVPMYWWSNIAVPEYTGGRILFPAEEAFTSDISKVSKVKIPMVNGVDVTKYQDIPDQVDYFFHVPKEHKKYIVNIDRKGYGLAHLSTDRLQSRKLFVWGQNDASDRWQEFLTEDAGRYIEIQAGLGKTQYGCIPMAPHTAWEWVEQYGPIQTSLDMAEKPFEQAREEMERQMEELFGSNRPEQKLTERRALAKKQGTLVMSGSGYAQLENRCREKLGQKPLCGHLDFASQDKRQREWLDFLNSGRLTEPDGTDRPADFTKDDIWLDLLRDAVKDQERDNWYAHYQLGLHDVYRSDLEKAEEAFRRSLALKDTAWARHGLAVCCLRTGDHMAAVNEMMAGLNMRLTDLSYVKEGMKLLLQLRAYERVLEVYGRLSEELRGESRVRFNYIQALAELGRYQEAMDLLMADGGLEVADIREGEDRMKSLWEMLCGGLYGDKGRPIPHRLNFTALQEQ